MLGDSIQNAVRFFKLLRPYAETSMLHLCEAEILATCGDRSVELVSKVLVAIVLWKIELCEKVSICTLQYMNAISLTIEASMT